MKPGGDPRRAANSRDRHERQSVPAPLGRGRGLPTKVAIETADGRDLSPTTTLILLSGQIANALVARGVEPGDRVAVQVEKSVANGAGPLSRLCLRAGAVYLPLNTAYTPAELEYFIGDAEPTLVVCDPARRDGIAGFAEPRGWTPRRDARPMDGRGANADRISRGGQSHAFPTVVVEDRRPRGDPLHVRHDRPLQGRHADARQPRVERADADATCRGSSRPTTCSSTRCRSTTRTGCSWRPTSPSCPMRLDAVLPQVRRRRGHAADAARDRVMMGVPTFYTRLLKHPGLTERCDRAYAAVHLRLGAAAGRDASRMARQDRPRHPRTLRHDRDGDEHVEPL